MPQVCLQFVIVVFPDHTHVLFFIGNLEENFAIFQVEGRPDTMPPPSGSAHGILSVVASGMCLAMLIKNDYKMDI